MADVFELRQAFEWRGLGMVPYSPRASASALRPSTPRRASGLFYQPVPDHKIPRMRAILRGVKTPPRP